MNREVPAYCLVNYIAYNKMLGAIHFQIQFLGKPIPFSLPRISPPLLSHCSSGYAQRRYEPLPYHAILTVFAQQSQSGSSNVNRKLILLTTAKMPPRRITVKAVLSLCCCWIAGDVAQSRPGGSTSLAVARMTGHQYINLLLYQIQALRVIHRQSFSKMRSTGATALRPLKRRWPAIIESLFSSDDPRHKRIR